MQLTQLQLHQGKQLNESSDDLEFIDSIDMSLNEDCNQKQNAASTQDSQALITPKSIDSNQNLRNEGKSQNDQLHEQTGANSARDRAKWGYKENKEKNFKNIEQNEQLKKNSKHSNQEQKQDKQSQIKELHEQYLAIKRQLSELQSTEKQVDNFDQNDQIQTLRQDRLSSSNSSSSFKEDFKGAQLRQLRKKKSNKQYKDSHFKSLDAKYPQEEALQKEKSLINHYVSIQSKKKQKENQIQSQRTKRKSRLSSMQSQLQLGFRKFSVEKNKQEQKSLKRGFSNGNICYHKNQCQLDECESQQQDDCYSCCSCCQCDSESSESSLCSCCRQEQYTQQQLKKQELVDQPKDKRRRSQVYKQKSNRNGSGNQHNSRVISNSKFKQSVSKDNNNKRKKSLEQRKKSENSMKKYHNSQFPINHQPPQWLNQQQVQQVYPQMNPIDIMNLQNYYAKIQQMNQQQQMICQLPIQQQLIQPQNNYIQPQIAPNCSMYQPLQQPQQINQNPVMTENIYQNKTTSFNNHSQLSDSNLNLRMNYPVYKQDQEKQNQLPKNQDTQVDYSSQKYEQIIQDLKREHQSRNDTQEFKLSNHSRNSTYQKFLYQTQNSQQSQQIYEKNSLNQDSNDQKSQQVTFDNRKTNTTHNKQPCTDQYKDKNTQHVKSNLKNKQDDYDFSNIAKESMKSIKDVQNVVSKLSQSIENNKNNYQTEKSDQQKEKNTQESINEQEQSKNNYQSKESHKEVLWIGFENPKSQRNPQVSKMQPNNNKQQHYVKEQQENVYKEGENKEYNSQNKRGELMIIDVKNQEDKIQNNEEENQYQTQQKEQAWAMDFSASPLKQKDINQDNKLKQLQNRLQQKSLKKSNSQKQEKEFSKEEIAKRKKQILKSARINASQINQQKGGTEQLQLEVDGPKNCKQSDNPQKLLSRLSSGVKAEINQKDMRKLTTKNYEQLPEIKKKKQEEAKKQELMKRISNVKELEQKRRKTIASKRQTMYNK